MKADPAPAAAATTGHVLVVDDNPALLAATARILRQAGFEVSEAADGNTALRLLAELEPHLVLLDVELPDISGLEVLKRIKADPKQSTVMVVMLSAHQRLSEVQAAALNQGADGYLVRPLPREELVARVRSQLRQGLMSAEQLRASEARYRQIVETSQEGIWIIAPDGRTSFANRQLEHLLGRVPGGLLGATVAELWLDRLPEALDPAAAALGAPQHQRVEGRLRRADGESVPVSTAVQALSSEAGEPMGLLAMVTDLSPQQQAQGQLKLLEAAVSRLNDMVVITEAGPLDEPGPRMVFVNEAFTRITGYTREQALGRSPRMLQSPLTDKAELARLRQALQMQQSVRCEVSNRNAAGRDYWIEMDISPVFDANGRCTHFVSVQRDITERRRQEQERLALLKRMELAVAVTGVGVWDYDLVTRELVWDDEMYRIYGRQRSAEREPYALWRESVHPDDQPAAEALMRSAEAGECDFDIEFRVCRPGGEVRQISASARLVRANGGPATRMVGINLDVTERRQAQAALEARRVAEQANRAKSEFIARMSHELRTPLNAILGFSELLRESTPDSPPELQRRHSEHIHTAGEHLLALITDLLDVSRIEAGLLPVQQQDVELGAVLRRVAAQWTPRADEVGARLVLALPDAPAWVRADPTRLQQVLQNLVSNAIKYGGTAGRVILTVAGEGSWTVATVQDHGPGMSAEQQAHLFEAFNRLGREHGGIEGTGIGLVISRQLVGLMGGELRVSSAPGEGSRFSVALRSSAGPTVADATPSAEAASADVGRLHRPGPPAQLLYVDDDPVNCELMTAMLQAVSSVVLRVAPDAASGLALARAQPPDLLLLDMMLPDARGIDLLAALRALPGLERVPAVAVTANAMPQDVTQALASGFSAYLTKPLSRSRLLETLTQVLD